MIQWILRNFPTGKWSWGWFVFQILIIAFFIGVAIVLNLREGKSWTGKETK